MPRRRVHGSPACRPSGRAGASSTRSTVLGDELQTWGSGNGENRTYGHGQTEVGQPLLARQGGRDASLGATRAIALLERAGRILLRTESFDRRGAGPCPAASSTLDRLALRGRRPVSSKRAGLGSRDLALQRADEQVVLAEPPVSNALPTPGHVGRPSPTGACRGPFARAPRSPSAPLAWSSTPPAVGPPPCTGANKGGGA